MRINISDLFNNIFHSTFVKMSRSSTEKFLVGQFKDHIPDDKLPTVLDVLKYLFFKKHEEALKSAKTPSKRGIISCPLDSSHNALCDTVETCTSKNLVFFVLLSLRG